MMFIKRYCILFILYISSMNISAQDLTGTWEGDMGTYQFLQINIIQNGNSICGYTWDHLTYNQQDFCKAFFEATFDKKKQNFILNGTSFLANSGGHVLMQLTLFHKYVNDQQILYYNPSHLEIITALLAGEQVETRIYLKKVSDKPAQVLPQMTDCLNEKNKTANKNIPKKPADTVVKIIVPEKPADTTTKSILPQKKDTPVIKMPDLAKDSNNIPHQLDTRKNTEQSRIEVNTKNINLKVYDNAIVDGDTVSIFYNGKLLLSHQPLTEKAIEINLTLDEKQTRHELILFAENLGSIPPNTALVVITAGDKRYELFASASLQENAVLVFDYRPK